MRAALLATTLLLGTFIPTMSHARDWKSIISSDRVQIANGKMTMEEYSICKVTVPGASTSSLQMRAYTEAPVGAVSRDFLVSSHAKNRTIMVVGLGIVATKGTSVSALNALDCAPITAPIGKVDLEMNLYLTAEGYQRAFVDGSTGKTTQESKRWEDVFGG